MPLYRHKTSGEYCRTVADSNEDDRLADKGSGWALVEQSKPKGKAETKPAADVRTGSGRAGVAIGSNGGDD